MNCCWIFDIEHLRIAEIRKYCRSRQELSNRIPIPTSISELFPCKIGVDTDENEPLKVHLVFRPWDLIFTEPPRPYQVDGSTYKDKDPEKRAEDDSDDVDMNTRERRKVFPSRTFDKRKRGVCLYVSWLRVIVRLGLWETELANA